MRQTAPLQPEAPKSRKRKAQSGYGMVLLMLFLMSSVLLAAAMPMMYGPGMANALGTSAQDSLSAKQVAASGLETVLADIQSKINAGTTVDVTYTYPSTPITAAQDPMALSGATVTLGSYSAAMTAAYGNNYLVKVTATVGNALATASKFFTITCTSKTLDNMVAPTAAYGLRKLRTAYNGYAVNVRRASDDTTQDIGFDASGNLDLDSLKTFLGTNTLPLDAVGSYKVGFGLRRLRNGYSGGVCINVRRSSDNTTQDIGFTPAGNLDVNALLNFVGTGNGYVATWYDQSGNGTNATQATTTMQPTIVINGVVNMINNRPVMKFDGVDDFLSFTRTVSADFTITASYSVAAGTGASDTTWANHAGIIDAYAGANTNGFGISVDNTGQTYMGIGNPDTSVTLANPGYNDGRMHWVAMVHRQNPGGTNTYTYTTFYNDGNFTQLSNANVNALSGATNITIGQLQDASTVSLSGYVGEVLVHNTYLSPSSVRTLQRNEGWYYNQSPLAIANDYPLTTVYNTPSAGTGPSPTVAYSLRKIRNAAGFYAIKVRRSSDNTTQDIGFDGFGYLDVQALMTFVGAGNSGYIDTWYDQSGNARNARQATLANQPMIVNAGTLVTYQGKPSIQFTAANSTNLTLTEITGITDYTAFVVHQGNSNPVGGTTAYRQLMYMWNGGGLFYQGFYDSGGGHYSNRDYYNYGYEMIMKGVSRTGSNATVYMQGAPTSAVGGTAGNGSTMNFGEIASLQGANFQNGYISEIILYQPVLSDANRQVIEKSAGLYYGPQVPVAYVTKWYDQSGNGNDAIQTAPFYQPTITMPRIYTFSNRPTLNFNGQQYLVSSAGMPTAADYSKVAVTSYTGAGNIISDDGAGNAHAWYGGGHCLWSNGTTYVCGTYGITSGVPMALAATYVESTKTGTMYRLNVANGTGTATVSNAIAGFDIGAYQKQSQHQGTISEAMVFSRVLSATDRTTIYNDEVGYYGGW